MRSQPPPLWLWRTVLGGVAALAAGVAALAAALSLGAADPPLAGPLLWQDDFKAGLGRWQLSASPGAGLAARDGALSVEFTAAGQQAEALTAAPPGAFTLEIAGAQADGRPGAAAYGLVLGGGGPAGDAAVLVTGTGYVEAWQGAGAGRRTWFAFQQWPHLLYGSESNRVRVDVAGGRARVRLNDELLGEYPLGALPPGGRLGVVARSSGAGRVVFSWVRVWAPR